jgi:hypothetical protein
VTKQTLKITFLGLVLNMILLLSLHAKDESFVEDVSGEPKYLRIDADKYHVRTSPKFSVSDTRNVDFKAPKGSIYPIKKMVKLRSGTAVNVLVEQEERWVFVPDWRRHDFQFCRSVACFTDAEDVLKFLTSQNITQEQLRECGFAVNADGNLVRHELPLEVSQTTGERQESSGRSSEELKELLSQIQMIKPSKSVKPAPAPVPSRLPEESSLAFKAEPLTMSPLWERDRGGEGRQWTTMMQDALDRHGKNLLNRKYLSDSDRFCPNFSRLSMAEKKEFWIHVFANIARRESGFKKQTTFDERTYRNVYRGPILPHRYSQGLFQMSYGSGAQAAYKDFCHFDWRKDRRKDLSDSDLTIYDPRNQIDCAVGVMNYAVRKTDGLGWGRNTGGARFWSTLRKTNPATMLVIQGLKRFKPCWR